MIIYREDGSLSREASALIKSCRSALSDLVSARPWLTATPILVGSEDMALQLVKLGAPKVLAIGASEGVRSAPLNERAGGDRVSSHCLHLSFEGGLMEGIRGGESALNELNASAEVVDDFDPRREAWVMRAIFSDEDHLAGRPVFGRRAASWKALEDKTVIDLFWDEAGVSRMPSVIAQLNVEAIVEAYHQVDQGSGVVIAGDNRSGVHGGASYTRWAKSLEQLELIISDLSQKCDQARVMPYLEGVPCSMHGWVFPNGEQISLIPCEMLVAESERATFFDYHGAATNWRPRDEITEQMTHAVRRAASYLASHYQYRGAFTIDGVATHEGFYPTELNPRFGGALSRVSAALPDLPLLTMHCATVEGYDLGISPKELSDLLISGATAKPVIRGMIQLDQACSSPQALYFKRRGEGWELCDEADQPDARANWGVATRGSLILANIDTSCCESGEAVGKLTRALLIIAKQIVLSGHVSVS